MAGPSAVAAARARSQWNRCTTVEQLRDQYAWSRPVDVNSIMLVQAMVRRESVVDAALSRLLETVDVWEADYWSASVVETQALFTQAFAEFLPRELETAIRHAMMFGYVAYGSRRVALNDGMDTVAVPVVHDPSMYVPFVCISKDGAVGVVCIPRSGLGPSAGTSATATVEPLQTFVWKCPDAQTGLLASPFGTLLCEWVDLQRMLTFRVTAVAAGANPVPVFAHVEPKQASRALETQFAGHLTAYAEVTGNTENGALMSEAQAMRFAELEESLREQGEDARAAAAQASPLVAWLDDPLSVLGKSERIALHAAVFPSSITVPAGMQYVGAAPVPQVPPNVNDAILSFRTSVAALVGVPMSVLGFSTNVRTTVAGENEARTFVASMSSYAHVFRRCAEEMYTYATKQRATVQIPIRVPQSLDMLYSLYEAWIIDRERLTEEVSRSYGIQNGGFAQPFSKRHADGPVVGHSVFGSGERLQVQTTGATGGGGAPAQAPTSTKRPRATRPDPEDPVAVADSDSDELPRRAAKNAPRGFVATSGLRSHSRTRPGFRARPPPPAAPPSL